MSLVKKPSFPNEVLLIILGKLSIQDLARAFLVSKHWNDLARSDILWKKFVPKWPGFVAPTKPSVYETVVEMWRSSIHVGKERWFPNPLPELSRYESRLRKAEYHRFYMQNSKTTLYVRLNPLYEFTTKGKMVKDTTMNEVCSEIWKLYRAENSESEYDIDIMSHEDVMNRARFISRQEIMKLLLLVYEPEWFLEGIDEDLSSRELDEDGELQDQSSDQEDEEVKEDDIGDVTNCTQEESIFGSFEDETAWNTKVNKRLPVHLYNQLKALFTDGSEKIIDYSLNDGCFNENYRFALSVRISDTAVFFHKMLFDI